jgi:hypothetical protein
MISTNYELTQYASICALKLRKMSVALAFQDKSVCTEGPHKIHKCDLTIFATLMMQHH